MNSALYEGRITHHRFARASTGGVEHRFVHRSTMALLYLDELAAVGSLHPWCSTSRPAPLRWRREDFGGDLAVPLDESLRDSVEAALGTRPTGPIALLCHLRQWGWSFNPIAVAYCFAEDGSTLEAIVLEVRNTPWHERHRYVLPPDEPAPFAKAFHVSPFLSMRGSYRLVAPNPGRSLSLRLTLGDDRETTFEAQIAMTRRPLTRRALSRLLLQRPWTAIAVTTSIYAHAARLVAKRAPFFPHPTKDRGGSP